MGRRTILASGLAAGLAGLLPARLAAQAKRSRERKLVITARDTFALADWMLTEDADALAVTGIAGPSGGSRAKPVGTVCFAWALPSDTGPTLGAETAWVKVETCHFEGDRAAVRQATHAHAIERLLELWHQR
jgi:hypothetical protein